MYQLSHALSLTVDVDDGTNDADDASSVVSFPEVLQRRAVVFAVHVKCFVGHMYICVSVTCSEWNY